MRFSERTKDPELTDDADDDEPAAGSPVRPAE
jgi:hypothetical protein